MFDNRTILFFWGDKITKPFVCSHENYQKNTIIGYTVYSEQTAILSILLSGADLTEYFSVHSGIRIVPKEHNYRQFRVFSFQNSPKRTLDLDIIRARRIMGF